MEENAALKQKVSLSFPCLMCCRSWAWTRWCLSSLSKTGCCNSRLTKPTIRLICSNNRRERSQSLSLKQSAVILSRRLLKLLLLLLQNKRQLWWCSSINRRQYSDWRIRSATPASSSRKWRRWIKTHLVLSTDFPLSSWWRSLSLMTGRLNLSERPPLPPRHHSVTLLRLSQSEVFSYFLICKRQ